MLDGERSLKADNQGDLEADIAVVHRQRKVHILKCLLLCLLSFLSYRTLNYSLGLTRRKWYNSMATHITATSISWTPCGDNLECGHLDVPMDYHSSVGTVRLAVAKYLAKADKKDRLGIIFHNPGGPGGSGVEYTPRVGKLIEVLTGGRYDVVGWDPRGVGDTRPSVDCYASEREQNVMELNLMYSDARNLSDSVYRKVHAAHAAYLDAMDEVKADMCYERSGESLNYIGTPNVVRDIVRLSSVIAGPGVPINYWGTSYGTIIGNFLVNMFPDLVGRVILDANIDSDHWANMPESEWFKYDLLDIEKVLGNFVSDCAAAGSDRCELAKYGRTGSALMARIDGLLEDLYERPLPVSHGADLPDVLTAASVKYVLFSAMYSPRSWPSLASRLTSAIEGDGAPMINAIQLSVTLNKSIETITRAVVCVDSMPYPDDIDKVELLKRRVDEDVLTGEVAPHFAGMLSFGCHHWKPRAKERFTGPWNHTLANPILVIGNTADPVTPLKHSRQAADRLGDSSRLIVQNTSGHSSQAVASLCTAKAIRAYLVDNALPEHGLFCKQSEVLFPSKDTPRPELYSLESGALLTEDVALLDAMKSFGEASSQQHMYRGRPF